MLKNAYLISKFFLVVIFFFFCSGALWAQQFSLAIADNGRLQIFSSRGEKIDDLPQATIGKIVEVPPVVFEVSYGKDISNLLSVIISPSPDRPMSLAFSVGGRRIQMDAQAVVTLTFSADKSKLRVDPGYIGQVTVDGNIIIEETEYPIITTVNFTEPSKQEQQKPSSAASLTAPSDEQNKIMAHQMPAAPTATTTQITPKPTNEDELPSLDEIQQDVPISFLGDQQADSKDVPSPPSRLSESRQQDVTKPSSPSALVPARKLADPKLKPADSMPSARTVPKQASPPPTTPLAQGFRPNRPLSVSRIDLGNVPLQSMLFAPRKGDFSRLASYYRSKAKDTKTPLIYPENYVQTPTQEFAVADPDQYPSRVFIVETFYWMEPVTPPNRAQAPRIAADKMCLVEINGEVKINTMPLNASKQQEVSSGSLIQTGSASSVAVFMGGVSSIRLAEKTSMRLQHRLISGFREVIAEVDYGLLFVKIGQRVGEEQRLIIRTPSGVVEAKGTDFAVWVDAEGTYVFLKSGQVNLMSGKTPTQVLTAPEDPSGLTLGSLQKVSIDRLHAMVPAVLNHLKNLNQKTNQILEKASRGLALQKNEKEYLQIVPTVDLITPVHRVASAPAMTTKSQETTKPTARDRLLQDIKDQMRF